MLLSSQTKIRVRYAETDRMGIVYHSNYLVWFEVGRTELFREIELPYTEFETQGIGLAVVDASCRYRKPALYDDELTIVTQIDKISSRGAKFSYKIFCDNTLLAEGKTFHIFVDKEGRATDIRENSTWERFQILLGI